MQITRITEHYKLLYTLTRFVAGVGSSHPLESVAPFPKSQIDFPIEEEFLFTRNGRSGQSDEQVAISLSRIVAPSQETITALRSIWNNGWSGGITDTSPACLKEDLQVSDDQLIEMH